MALTTPLPQLSSHLPLLYTAQVFYPFWPSASHWHSVPIPALSGVMALSKCLSSLSLSFIIYKVKNIIHLTVVMKTKWENICKVQHLEHRSDSINSGCLVNSFPSIFAMGLNQCAWGTIIYHINYYEFKFPILRQNLTEWLKLGLKSQAQTLNLRPFNPKLYRFLFCEFREVI